MAAISIFFSILLFSFSEATTYGRGGFTTSLFHRDSLLSPLRRPSLSHYDRLHHAFRRSFARSAALFNRAAAVASPAAIQSPLTPGSGEYLIEVSIGTPPVDFLAIADTGSDLVWTQCLPCRKCFNQSLPIFDPRRSSSFRHVACTSDPCRILDVSQCGAHQICDYSYTYGDQSYTKGELGFDKITLGSFPLSKTVVGCGHESDGGFGDIASGVIGLGGGPLSLVSQLNKYSNVTRRFSYCLPNVYSQAKLTAKINFGGNAVVSGSGVVSTPFVPKLPVTYYYITLEAVSVGNQRHEAAAKMSFAAGNMIIDSGTTLTFLPQELYDSVVSSLVRVVRARRVEDPGGVLGLCFAAEEGSGGVDFPTITAHFSGGADVRLPAVNTFERVADDVSCLTMASSSDFGILGNLAQMNFLIGYDMEAMRLSFKSTVCA